MNWDDIRVFLAVRRAGTLRGASRELGVDQTTVGRRLAALESGLGVTLFLRSPGGYALTGEGERALAAAERMGRERIAVPAAKNVFHVALRLTQSGRAYAAGRA